MQSRIGGWTCATGSRWRYRFRGAWAHLGGLVLHVVMADRGARDRRKQHAGKRDMQRRQLEAEPARAAARASPKLGKRS